jgi:hypothetical protein
MGVGLVEVVEGLELELVLVRLVGVPGMPTQ